MLQLVAEIVVNYAFAISVERFAAFLNGCG
jgi:hypothetical protein